MVLQRNNYCIMSCLKHCEWMEILPVEAVIAQILVVHHNKVEYGTYLFLTGYVL